MTATSDHFDVIIIGAGPAGALAATLLVQRGLKIAILEKCDMGMMARKSKILC